MFPKPTSPARDPRQRGGFKRKAPRRKPPRRLDGPGADPAFLAHVRLQACAGTVDFAGHVCRGPMEANHATQGRGIGQKAPDRRSFAMDHELHRLWHAHRGPFAGWSKLERRAFEERHIQRMLDAATPGDREEALRLAARGLGTWDEASATWTPGPQREEGTDGR